MDKAPIIMVVEDDPLVSDLLRTFLRSEGFSVVDAGDGVSALRLLEKRTPDLILMDIIMPGLNGVALLNLVRRRSNVPIIMMTAISDPVFIENALADGADDYVTKPFVLPDLKGRIEAKLGRSGSGGGRSSSQ